MNENVMNNRQNIDQACTSCFRSLVSYSSMIRDHKKAVQQVNAAPYIQEEKLRQINELEAKLKDQVAPICEEIRRQVDVIRDAAYYIERAPMDSMDLSAIGTLTNLLSAAASTESVVDILGALTDYANTYRGQQKALTIIKVAMERTGNPNAEALKSKYGHSLLFHVRDRIGKVDRVVGKMEQPNINHAFDLARELEAFAWDMGVELSSSFKKMMNAVNSDDYEDAYFTRMLSLMGLGDTI